MFYAKQEESITWVTVAKMGLLAARAPSLIRNHCQGTGSVCFQIQLSCQNILCYHLVWQHYLKVLTQTCLGDTLWNILIGELISFPALLCNSESHLAGTLSSLASVQHNHRARAPEETAAHRLFLPLPKHSTGQWSETGHQQPCWSQGYSCTQPSTRLSDSSKFCRLKSSVCQHKFLVLHFLFPLEVSPKEVILSVELSQCTVDFHRAAAAKSCFLAQLPWTQIVKLTRWRALAINLYCKQK